MTASDHTALDLAAFVAAGVDPTTVQARDHTVLCIVCRRPSWHRAGYCDRCYQPPSVVGAVSDRSTVGARLDVVTNDMHVTRGIVSHLSSLPVRPGRLRLVPDGGAA